ncbi:DUF1427 family protein [Erwinia billingiae]|nr:DUF1427 family protein [Erwinia billingiae]
MSPLLTSLGAGVLVGLFYALLNVRSPAPCKRISGCVHGPLLLWMTNPRSAVG